MAREENPYAPPGADDEAPPASGDERKAFEKATLWRRLGGALVDTVFNILVLYGVHAAFSLTNTGELPTWAHIFGPGAAAAHALETLAASVLPMVIMAALIAARAQSVGKIVVIGRSYFLLPDHEGGR